MKVRYESGKVTRLADETGPEYTWRVGMIEEIEGNASVKLKRTPSAGLHFTVFVGGEFKNAIALRREGEYLITADTAQYLSHIYTDPLEAALASRNIPVERLVRVSRKRVFEVDIESPGRWSTDGQWGNPRMSGEQKVCGLENASFAICWSPRLNRQGNWVNWVKNIYVWPQIDPDELGKALDQEMK